MPSFLHYKHFVSALKYTFWNAQRTRLLIAVAAEAALCPGFGAPIFYLSFYFAARRAFLVFVFRRFLLSSFTHSLFIRQTRYKRSITQKQAGDILQHGTDRIAVMVSVSLSVIGKP